LPIFGQLFLIKKMPQDNDKIQITQEGFDGIKQEYDRLVATKRPQVVERLADARREGDLSENSEYQQARQELSFVDGRLTELEEMISRAQVVAARHDQCVQVALGCQVTVASSDGQEQVFHLVGQWEADPAAQKISAESPLGKSLLGKKIGDQVEVEVPAGRIHYQVLKID